MQSIRLYKRKAHNPSVSEDQSWHGSGLSHKKAITRLAQANYVSRGKVWIKDGNIDYYYTYYTDDENDIIVSSWDGYPAHFLTRVV